MADTAVRPQTRTCDWCGRPGTRGFEGPRCADSAACHRRRERPAMAPAQGADRNRLPARPVLAEVVRLARRRRLSLRELLGPELFGAYGNAQVAGTMSLVTLERFCDEVLGWHPRSLYGDAYDRAANQPRRSPRGRGRRPREGPSRCP
ncbi:MAG TPA: hypothetical protein VG276_04925 [Actinomycetes bacterium]|nr:hypothetical protein [Actinomycetes bacterium]